MRDNERQCLVGQYLARNRFKSAATAQFVACENWVS
jgi:hypothetical protein